MGRAYQNKKDSMAKTAGAKTKVYSKYGKEIYICAKNGGVDPDGNLALRRLIDRAKKDQVPTHVIERAIDKAKGGGGEDYVATRYEGYGPGGGAILLQALTPNRNRTAADVRSTFNKCGGNLGESGCVAWNFESKGLITVEMADEEKGEELSLVAIDAGADDVKLEDGILEIFTAPEQLFNIRGALEAEGIKPESAELSMVPKTTITLDETAAEQTLKLLDILEELDDIQKAYTNADFPAEVLERYQESS